MTIHATSLSSVRRALIGLGVIGFLLGLVVAAITLKSDHVEHRALEAALVVVVAWSFIGTGLYAWDRRPDNILGALMVAVGFAWYLPALWASEVPALFIFGLMMGSAPFAFIVHMLFAFPDGHVGSRFNRILVATGYSLCFVVAIVPVLFLDTPAKDECDGCPENPVLLSDSHETAELIYQGMSVIGVFALGAIVVQFVRRARTVSDVYERRRDAPVWVAGAVTMLLLASSLASNFGPEQGNYDDVLYYLARAAIVTVPFAFLLGLLRQRLTAAEETELENIRLDAELQARLDELHRSRARIVQAEHTARRELERDLHDGAQQHLVSLALDLRLARNRLPEDPREAARILDEANEKLGRATEELRELARGIHPAVLSDRGLSAAVDGLATRTPLPVEVQEDLNGRLSPEVEAAAYFVVAEALTNVAKHAGADSARVAIHRDNGALDVSVADDGAGGANLSGSGLRGLADRVAAFDGTLDVHSPEGEGTVVRARIPLPAVR
jgi:signal transduction histidine kinase